MSRITEVLAYMTAEGFGTLAKAEARAYLSALRRATKSKTATYTHAEAKELLAAKTPDGQPLITFDHGEGRYADVLSLLMYGITEKSMIKRINDAVAQGRAKDVSDALMQKLQQAPKSAPSSDAQFRGYFVMSNGQQVPLSVSQYKAIKALLELPEVAEPALV